MISAGCLSNLKSKEDTTVDEGHIHIRLKLTTYHKLNSLDKDIEKGLRTLFDFYENYYEPNCKEKSI